MDSFLVILVKLTSFCRLSTRCHTQMRNWPYFSGESETFIRLLIKRGQHIHIVSDGRRSTCQYGEPSLCRSFACVWVRLAYSYWCQFCEDKYNCFYCHFTTIIMHFVWGPALIIWKRTATEIFLAHCKSSPLRLSNRRKLIRVDQIGVQQHKDEYDNYIYG